MERAHDEKYDYLPTVCALMGNRPSGKKINNEFSYFLFHSHSHSLSFKCFDSAEDVQFWAYFAVVKRNEYRMVI